LSGGILTISGTIADEQISIGQSSNTITIYDNGTALPTTYTNAQVTNKIVVNAGAGNDLVRVHSRTDNLGIAASTTPVTEVFEINGEAGNDTLGGSDFADTIVGGSGNDTCNGYDGADSIYGDITGVIGTAQGLQTGYVDVLSGGNDADQILGQWGADTVNGDDGGDTLYGDFGIVTTGLGSATDDNDTVNGGAGGDLIFGDAGGAYGTTNAGGDDHLNGEFDDDMGRRPAPSPTAATTSSPALTGRTACTATPGTTTSTAVTRTTTWRATTETTRLPPAPARIPSSAMRATIPSWSQMISWVTCSTAAQVPTSSLALTVSTP
jgi:Ca2+-binding RTX toxin-like protein